MDGKEVRILAKKVLLKKKFLKTVELKADIWTAEEANAWKSFCFTVPGFSKYSAKVPSDVTISTEDVKILKGFLISSKEAKNKNEEEPASAPKAPENKPADETPTEPEEPKEPEKVAEEPTIEEPTEEEVAEEPTKEEESAPAPKAPVKKKGSKKSKK